MSASQPKRRRTKGAFTTAVTSRRTRSRKMTVTWPEGQIPVEIFAIIVSYLSRSNVQNMRLVNKEFEVKVSQYLFKTVVVPFRPEIYGITEDPSTRARQGTEIDRQRKLAVMLQEKGMRVFQGFGRHIHRFAMTFEFDYEQLTKPPLKSDQEAITTFWGIYRWPFKAYHRYEALEGLEQTADETHTMATALRHIEKCKELGLSIDGGLGWLAGPDVNSKVQSRTSKATVFGESVFRPEEKRKSITLKAKALESEPSLPDLTTVSQGSDNDGIDGAWRQMLREAGYEGRELDHSLHTLRESEDGVPLLPLPSSSFNFISSSDPAHSAVSSLSSGSEQAAANSSIDQLQRFRVPPGAPARLRSLLNQAELAFLSTRNETTEVSGSHFPLKPNDLTNAQKEMLLETEWAQRAFMQSYAIAVIDNRATFQKVEKLTIARLPSRHLSILRRKDFWSGLSGLKSVSLAVIPDWRDVAKQPTSWVEDNQIAPSAAINGVWGLLKDHIAPNPSITTLHFEWVGGGEEAPGIFARNQHVVAAPLYTIANGMMNNPNTRKILNFPHVQHLSLKNCWISPHVLIKFGKALRGQALESLTLCSVSLTAPLDVPAQGQNGNANPFGAQPQQGLNNGLINGAQPQQLVPMNQGGVPFPLMQIPGPLATPAQQPTSPDSWLDTPRYGSWAQVIDAISPGDTLASLRFSGEEDKEDPPPIREDTNLQAIYFSSCGYLRLPFELDQSMLDPPGGRQVMDSTTAIAKRRAELDPIMMRTNDRFIGSITNYISEAEIRTLENAWGLTIGWGEEGELLAAQALADGVKNAGQGRFRGTIMKSQT